MSVTLTLGDVTFEYSEIPEQIPFGGDQAIVKHRQAGGARTIDAIGPDEDDLSWSGLFLGATAEGRAKYLNQMRQQGQEIDLTWSTLRYRVVIASFKPVFMQKYRIPYSITCAVVSDESNRVETLPPNTIDMQLRADQATADGLVSGIGDSTLSGLMSGLDAAISAVSDFAKATTATLNTVLRPLADVTARVDVLIGSVGATAQNLATLGGVLPNNSVAQKISNTMSQVTAYEQLPQLYGLQSTLGRMNGNIGLLGSGSGHSITVFGADLQQLAVKYYGDVTQWPVIAAANNLRDPVVSGQANIVIPSKQSSIYQSMTTQQAVDYLAAQRASIQ